MKNPDPLNLRKGFIPLNYQAKTSFNTALKEINWQCYSRRRRAQHWAPCDYGTF